jgi:hypothetical protein
MKRAILLVLLMLAAASRLQGAAVLKGRITLQDSGAAAANARVTAIGANPTATNSSGVFELHFPDKQPGDVVNIQVEKTGLVVVNKKDLERGNREQANKTPKLQILLTFLP